MSPGEAVAVAAPLGYGLAFAGGLVGSVHCLGMCGAFPLAIAARGGRASARGQLLYHAGRLQALALIGALAGSLGAALVWAGPARRVLALGAGSLMVAIGAERLGWLPLGVPGLGPALERGIGRSLREVLSWRSPAAPFALGAANAFLPCHLVYAFAAQAAASGSLASGAATMIAFGAGTVPALLALGIGGQRLGQRSRRVAERLVSAAVVLYGLGLVARGIAAG